MAVQFRCRGCEEVLKAPDAARGKVMTCKSCGTKNKVPAGKPKAKAKAAKTPPKRRDEDTLAGDLSAEDSRYVTCQKCGQQYLSVDEEGEPISTCHYCGWDTERGEYTKEAKRERLKSRGKLDQTEYYEVGRSEPMQFLLRDVHFALKSGLYVLIPGTLCLVFAFLAIYNGKGPPKMFFGFLSCVFGLGTVGWLLVLCQATVRLTLDNKERFKRFHFDFFQCAADGVTLLSLQIAWLFPAILLMLGAYLYGEDQHEVGIVLMALGPVLMVPFYPVILSHLAMPVAWPAWLFTKGMQVWAKTIVPSFYLVLFTTLVSLPALIGLGVAGGVFGGDVEKLLVDVDYNAKLGYEKYLAERGDLEQAPEGEYRELDFEPVIPPLVITLVSLYYIGFVWLYPARMNGWFAYYFKKDLELIQEKAERKYVARERKIDDEGNVVVVKGGPPDILIRLGGTVLFYVVANVVCYFVTGGKYVILPAPLARAMNLINE